MDSRPPALLRLHKDGVLLASSPPDPWATAERLSVTAATNSLRVGISDVQLEDEGEYECSASNAYGNASTTANLTAGTAHLWISPSPDVLEGDTVNLTCAVHSGARAALTYTWYRDGVPLSSGPDPTITILSATSAAAGSYSCTAHGPSGSRSTAPRALRVHCEWGLWGHSPEPEGENTATPPSF
ncbi:sialoadhesin-like [Meleagris gallopavo]|uniref:sialoadhesin-like n=1 Tax=Meleagris gallopavo TaxID=9103 RepID=UPI000549C55B|nr:sialoadhesin-like [Meleagris gallopavo]